MYRANSIHGLSNDASMLNALRRMGKSVSGMARAREVGAKLDRCGGRYGAWMKLRVLRDSDAHISLFSVEELMKRPPLAEVDEAGTTGEVAAVLLGYLTVLTGSLWGNPDQLSVEPSFSCRRWNSASWSP
jgi:hypothetical protein